MVNSMSISCQIDYNTDEAWNILNTAETFQFSKDSDSEINAPRSDVWKAWSGEELLKFRGQVCQVDLTDVFKISHLPILENVSSISTEEGAS